MLTLEEAKKLKHGQTIYHVVNRNADGSPQRWRINGKVKTWKRNPNRIQVPIKWGLKTCDYLTEENLMYFYLNEEEALDNNNRIKFFDLVQ